MGRTRRWQTPKRVEFRNSGTKLSLRSCLRSSRRRRSRKSWRRCTWDLGRGKLCSARKPLMGLQRRKREVGVDLLREKTVIQTLKLSRKRSRSEKEEKKRRKTERKRKRKSRRHHKVLSTLGPLKSFLSPNWSLRYLLSARRKCDK